MYIYIPIMILVYHNTTVQMRLQIKSLLIYLSIHSPRYAVMMFCSIAIVTFTHKNKIM